MITSEKKIGKKGEYHDLFFNGIYIGFYYVNENKIYSLI